MRVRSDLIGGTSGAAGRWHGALCLLTRRGRVRGPEYGWSFLVAYEG
jgi:hypothetical protein